MAGVTYDRPLLSADYIIKHQTTVRDTARAFGISKSTVHKDVCERLKRIDPLKYREVRAVLEQNKAERHIRGGEATREKYAKLKGNCL